MPPTIAKRVGGAVQVRLYDKGCKWRMGYPGHGRKFTAAETNKAKRWWCYRQALGDEQIITNSPDQGFIDAINYADLPNGGGYWEVAHYPDASQDIRLTDWNVNEGEWEELDDPDYPGTLLHQRDSTVDEGALVASDIMSKFVLPANPYILLNLWRAEPPKDADRTVAQPSTIISFGDDASEFALVIPYDGQPAYVEVFEPSSSEWRKLEPENKTKLPAIDGITKGQRLWVSIRVILGKLMVSLSRDLSDGQTAVYPLPDREWTFVGISAYYPDGWTWVPRVPGVKPGMLRIQHNAGQLAFRWWPLYCMPGPQYLWYLGEVETTYTCWETDELPGIEEGYLPEECRIVRSEGGGGTTNGDVYYYPVWHYDGADWGIVSDEPVLMAYNPKAGEVGEEENTTYSWYAAIEAVEYDLTGNDPEPNPDVPTGIRHYQSPVLRGVQVRAEPYVAQADEDWPESTDISEYVTGVVVSFPENAAGGTATVNLDKNTTSLTIYENQMIEIELGYRWSDGQVRKGVVFVGYVATPGINARPGSVTANMIAYDPTTRLKGEKAQALEPDFQTLSPKAAIEWLLKRAGFHTNQIDLAGSDDPMYLGQVGPDGSQANGGLDADNEALTPPFGSELLQSVQAFCRYDDQSEWWIIPDATHKFKFVKCDGQLGADDGMLYELQDDAPEEQDVTSLVRRAIAIEVESTTMDSGDYADCVVVQGTDPDGIVLRQLATLPTRWTDPNDAGWSGGWRHMHCEEQDSTQSDGRAAESAEQILTKRSRLPINAKMTCDLLTPIVKGERVHVTSTDDGGKAARVGVRSTVEAPKQFRVVGYEHHWDGRGTWPVTVIEARSLYDER